MAAICTGSGPAWTSFYFSSRIKFLFNAVMFIYRAPIHNKHLRDLYKHRAAKISYYNLLQKKTKNKSMQTFIVHVS